MVYYTDVLWCGVVWSGVVWFGVMWFGVAWSALFRALLNAMLWCAVLWCGVVWCGVTWCQSGWLTDWLNRTRTVDFIALGQYNGAHLNSLQQCNRIVQPNRASQPVSQRALRGPQSMLYKA